MTQKISLSAYHGTFSDHLAAIAEIGFQPSRNDDDWLGLGSYFFIDGLNDPKSSALQWAICSSWDKQSKSFQENSIAVVKTKLTAPANCIFDLRLMENAKEFHLFRTQWIQNQKSSKLTDFVRPKERTYDAEVLNDFREKNGINILIANFHIQLTTHERHLRLDSRIPNVSVLCLSNVSESSVQCSISEVMTSDAADWLPKFKT